jgi:hypothetical protein
MFGPRTVVKRVFEYILTTYSSCVLSIQAYSSLRLTIDKNGHFKPTEATESRTILSFFHSVILVVKEVNPPTLSAHATSLCYRVSPAFGAAPAQADLRPEAPCLLACLNHDLDSYHPTHPLLPSFLFSTQHSSLTTTLASAPPTSATIPSQI